MSETGATIGSDFMIQAPEDIEDAIAKVKAEASAKIKALRMPPEVEIEKVKAETREKLKKLRILLRTARKIHGTVKG